MTFLSPADTLAALHWRYATKQFDPDRAIPPDIWQVLVQSLVLAPSSFGLQPWRFLLIEDAAVRATLRAHSWNQSQVTEAARLVVLAARTDLTDADVDRWIDQLAAIRGADPATLQPLRDLAARFAAGMDPAARHAWCCRQLYLALGQLMTTAAMLGIDSCPLEGLDPAAYDRHLGLTATGFTTIVACALGYRSPADKHAALPKARFPLAAVVQTV